MNATIPLARQDTEPPPPQDKCDGCKHNHYSMTDGDASHPERGPHSWCSHFYRVIPALVHKGRWYGSEIPAGCPTFAQGEMF